MGVTLTQEMIKGAQETEKKYGVPASVTLAQIQLESGGNNPGGLSTLAYKDNNLFGIKAGSSWSGDTSTYQTTEYGKNGYYTTSASFRSYDSVADSIEDHGKLLNTSIYTNKTNSATNLTEYVTAMGSVYATDPNYASKVMNIINSNNLTQYDQGTFKGGTKTSSSTSSTTKTSSSTTSSKSSTTSSSSSGGIITLPTQYIDNTASIWEIIKEFLKKLILLIACIVLIISAVMFFMQAFDIKIPSKKEIAGKLVKEVATK